MFTIQKLFILIMIYLLLHVTGIWPMIMRAVRKWATDVAAKQGHFPPSAADGTELELCYRLFGLSPSAKWEEIEKAYRRKAKIHHPDHGGDEDAMRALNEAYQTLKRLRKP
jgi:hypothetical protein